MSLSLDQIRTTLKSVGLKKKLSELSLTLHCLLTGLKPSYLWDLGPLPSINQLINLKTLLPGHVLVLRLEGDFILTPRVRLEGLLRDLDSCPPVFIDISEGGEPEIVTLGEAKISDIKTILGSVLSSQEDIVEVIDGAQCVPCLYGLLLGFPVVYTFSGQSGNSLGGRQLVVVRMEAFCLDLSSCPTSFSVPSSLWGQVEGRVRSWWRGLGGGEAFGGTVTEKGVTVGIKLCSQSSPIVVL